MDNLCLRANDPDSEEVLESEAFRIEGRAIAVNAAKEFFLKKSRRVLIILMFYFFIIPSLYDIYELQIR